MSPFKLSSHTLPHTCTCRYRERGGENLPIRTNVVSLKFSTCVYIYTIPGPNTHTHIHTHTTHMYISICTHPHFFRPGSQIHSLAPLLVPPPSHLPSAIGNQNFYIKEIFYNKSYYYTNFS